MVCENFIFQFIHFEFNGDRIICLDDGMISSSLKNNSRRYISGSFSKVFYLWLHIKYTTNAFVIYQHGIVNGQGTRRCPNIITYFTCLPLVGSSPRRINQSNGVKVMPRYPPTAGTVLRLRRILRLASSHDENLIVGRWCCHFTLEIF